MKYSDCVKLNYNFSKSVNILLDKKIDYVETTSAKKALKAFEYHNAIAIIGPFGSGKSAFLLYLEDYIKKKHKDYKIIKIVADNRSFLEHLKEVFNVDKNSVLEILKEKKNEKIVFLIDEFGRFLENDALDIQAFAEVINKNENFKLVVAFHKSFNEYNKDLSKIQGRFENIVFRDDAIESIKILKKCFIYNNCEVIKETRELIKKITSQDIFLDITPLHPFVALAIVEIFNKFFQNQRSIYSFLFSTEKGGFSEFLSNKSKGLYTLSEFYDYLVYLLEVYDISLIDKEAYYLSLKRLKSNLSSIEKDIIKALSVVDIFKLDLNLNKENLAKTFIDRYSADDIQKAIDSLLAKNLITFLVNKDTFSLVEDLNIDLNKELQHKKEVIRISKEDINSFLYKRFIAKEFFIEYGNEIIFERVYNQKGDYKIIVSQNVYNNPKSITLNVEFKENFYDALKELKALQEIKEENLFSISSESKEIIDELIEDKKEFLNTLLEELIKNSKIYYKNKKYDYSYKMLQHLMSVIAKEFIYKAPKINNYTLIHTTSKQQNTSHIKKLFEALLKNSDKENLGIEKYPPHKALYLSVVKASGIHKNNKLTYPDKLNFEYIFEFFDEKTKKYVYAEEISKELLKEPFMLKENISLFLLSLYIIVNKELISLFDDKGFIFDLDENILIHLIKNPKKYKLKKINLSDKEKELFKEYARLVFKKQAQFDKDTFLSVVRELFKRFNAIADYSKYTTTLSKKSINLRSAFLSAKDPFKTLFEDIPKSLGYDDEFDVEEFIEDFRKYFNEIVFSYKKMILDLENHIKKSFLFERNFPFDVSKFKQTTENKEIINAFLYSDSIVELIDNLGILIVNKKSKEFLDKDVDIFKEKISQIAKKMLLHSSLNKNFAKIVVGKDDEVIEEVVKIESNPKIEEKLKYFKDLTKEEKLLLAYKLIEGVN
jgi:thymidine kinase